MACPTAPDTGDKQYFKILSNLAGVDHRGEMPLKR